MEKTEEILEVIISELDYYIINKVRDLRESGEISQVRLSILMELAEGTVGKIENPKERSKYNIRHLNLLAKALKCSPKDLLPEKALRNDMIKITYKINKHKKDKEKSYFEVISIKPIEQ